MHLRFYLKKFAFLDSLNSYFKTYFHEYKAERTTKYYLRQAEFKQLKPLSKTELTMAFRKHLSLRKIQPKLKSKGDLHIFLAFALNNWESVLPVALKAFGQVTVFEWRSLGFDDRSSQWLKYRDSMNAQMLQAFKKAHSEQPIDAVVGYLAGYYIDPTILCAMAEMGAVIFNFCWDDKLNFPGKIIGGRYSSTAAIASAVDLNLTNSPESVIRYFVHGGLAMFWPEAAHPHIHKPYDLPFEYDVTFVGGKYGWRPKFIAKLQRMGIKVSCFGNGWGNGSLSDEELIKLYSRSRINLGFAGVGYSKNLMCLKGRDFEVPMSGGLYLTQNNPELHFVYEVGKEILTYEDEFDCAKKIKWLLEHPEKGEQIRQMGRMRALRDHTWARRFHEIFRMSNLLQNDV